MKKLFALLLSFVLLVSLLPAAPAAADDTPDPEKYVTLDGEWHFKLYRTYSQMFQYFPYYGGSAEFLKWEDPALALLPDAALFSTWE